MSRATDPQRATAAALRHAFDQGFARAPAATVALLEDVLAVRVGGDPYALRLAELGGLHADRTLVPVPSPVPELLGVVGLRGVVVPVYDLGALLGYPRASGARWLALGPGASPVGLAIERVEQHLRVAQHLPSAAEHQAMARPHLRGVLSLADGLRPMIHVASVFEAIETRARGALQGARDR